MPKFVLKYLNFLFSFLKIFDNNYSFGFPRNNTFSLQTYIIWFILKFLPYMSDGLIDLFYIYMWYN